MSKMKRLELLLPADHEIFSYPSGSRRGIAAKCLDIGMQLSRIETKIDSIENYIADVTVVEDERKGLGLGVNQITTKPTSPSDKDVKKAVLEMFEKW